MSRYAGASGQFRDSRLAALRAPRLDRMETVPLPTRLVRWPRDRSSEYVRNQNLTECREESADSRQGPRSIRPVSGSLRFVFAARHISKRSTGGVTSPKIETSAHRSG
jgi:hypothetical protein